MVNTRGRYCGLFKRIVRLKDGLISSDKKIKYLSLEIKVIKSKPQNIKCRL